MQSLAFSPLELVALCAMVRLFDTFMADRPIEEALANTTAVVAGIGQEQWIALHNRLSDALGAVKAEAKAAMSDAFADLERKPIAETRDHGRDHAGPSQGPDAAHYDPSLN